MKEPQARFTGNILKGDPRLIVLDSIADILEHPEGSTEALQGLKDRMHDRRLSPVATLEDLEAAAEHNPLLGELFEQVLKLSDGYSLRDIPPLEEFEIIEQPYIGADGITRFPTPKYIPRHMAKDVRNMQTAYRNWLERNPQYLGPNNRPGLIIQSGYHSPYYQVAVMVKEMLDNGIESALERITLPHESHHTDPDYCGIDLVNIGGFNGNVTHPSGSPHPFGDTYEFAWLLKYAVNYGFYFPYSPLSEDPNADISFVPGAQVAENHLKYVGDSEYVDDLMRTMGATNAFFERMHSHGYTTSFTTAV